MKKPNVMVLKSRAKRRKRKPAWFYNQCLGCALGWAGHPEIHEKRDAANKRQRLKRRQAAEKTHRRWDAQRRKRR